MELAAAQGATAGTTVLTINDASEATSYKYLKNPAQRAVYGASYSGAAVTSGTTEIAAAAGDVVEVAGIKGGKVVAAGYITLAATAIKA